MQILTLLLYQLVRVINFTHMVFANLPSRLFLSVPTTVSQDPPCHCAQTT